MKRIRRLVLLGLTGLALAWAWPVEAQQFVTQSGGRGLVNAKTNARLTKTEKDVGDLQAEMALVKPHAKTEITQCVDTGAKLRWDGNIWTCDSETDPTVQGWAKEALPTCAPGSLLGVSGGQFSCNTSGFVSNEVDPTVQNFAKNPLPSCGTGQLLGVNADGSLRCVTDEQGLTAETDPFVHDFARTDKATVQNCIVGEVSKMVGSRLTCVVDQVGITVETDPNVQDFARNDIAGYSLAACVSGEILTTVTSGGKVLLECGDGQAALGEVLALDDLKDVAITAAANDEVLRYNGTSWVNSSDKIGSLVNGSTCTYNGTDIVCTQSGPGTCGSGQVLKWNGTNWVCEDAATTIATAIKLDDLGDVTITTPVTGHVVQWDGAGWVNVEKRSITHGDSSVLVTDAGTGIVQLVPDGVAILTATGGQVGIRTNNPGYDLDVNGDANIATNLRVGGDMTVGGDVSFTGDLHIAGVTFANGGLQATGGLVADSLNVSDATVTSLTVGDISATNLRVDGLVSLTDVAVNDLQVYGNLNVSGSQTIDGVLFANGGVTADAVSAQEGTIVSLTSQDVSVTRNMTVAGGLSAAAIGVTNLAAGNTTASSLTVTGDGKVMGDLLVEGNLNVSGSQTIDGVLFANGGVTADAVNAQEGTIVSLTSQDVSITRNLTVAGETILGSTTVANGYVTGDWTIYGNLNVSGTQTLGGVLFADGGVSATGAITATVFYGDGSQLSGVNAETSDWHGILNMPVQVVAVSDSTYIEMAGIGVTGTVTSTLISSSYVSATNVSISNILTADAGQFTTLGANAAGLGAVAANSVSVTGGLAAMGNVGLGTYAPNAKLDVYGDVSATNLRLSGNLYVSGTQTIDGVIFANGGVSATGAVTATNFYGDGSGLTNVTAASMNWYGLVNIPAQVVAVSDSGVITLAHLGVGGTVTATAVSGTYLYGQYVSATQGLISGALTAGSVGTGNLAASGYVYAAGAVSAGTIHTSGTVMVSDTLYADAIRSLGDLFVGGNFYVSGSQTIDGVIFANGGVSATGAVTATSFSGDGSGLTGLSGGSIAAEGVAGSVQFKGADGNISGTSSLVWSETDKNLDVAGTVQMAGSGLESCGPGSYGMMRFVDAGGGVYKLAMCRP